MSPRQGAELRSWSLALWPSGQIWGGLGFKVARGLKLRINHGFSPSRTSATRFNATRFKFWGLACS